MSRSPMYEQPMSQFKVTITDSQAKYLRQVGDGNLSAGIRSLVPHLPEDGPIFMDVLFSSLGEIAKTFIAAVAQNQCYDGLTMEDIQGDHIALRINGPIHQGSPSGIGVHVVSTIPEVKRMVSARNCSPDEAQHIVETLSLPEYSLGMWTAHEHPKLMRQLAHHEISKHQYLTMIAKEFFKWLDENNAMIDDR